MSGRKSALQRIRTKMGQQHRKVTKRRRRIAYIRRRKEQAKVSYSGTGIPMARRVVSEGEEVVTEVVEKAPGKKASTGRSATGGVVSTEAKPKKTSTRKAPAKKAPSKKEVKGAKEVKEAEKAQEVGEAKETKEEGEEQVVREEEKVQEAQADEAQAPQAEQGEG